MLFTLIFGNEAPSEVLASVAAALEDEVAAAAAGGFRLAFFEDFLSHASMVGWDTARLEAGEG